jgi:hypothetical protein
MHGIDALPHGPVMVRTEGGSVIEIDLSLAHASIRARVARGDIEILGPASSVEVEQDRDASEQVLRDRIADLEVALAAAESLIAVLERRSAGEPDPLDANPFAGGAVDETGSTSTAKPSRKRGTRTALEG